MMLRQFLIFILSLSLFSAQINLAWAIQNQNLNYIKNYYSELGIVNKEISYESFYKKNVNNFTTDLKKELEVFLKEYPKSKMPKFTMVTMGQATTERLRLESRDKEFYSYVDIYAQPGKFAVLHTERKLKGGKIKTFERSLSEMDLRDPLLVMRELTGIKSLSYMAPSIELLTKEEIKKLGEKQRREYIDKVRDLLLAAEKVQNSNHRKKEKKVSINEYYWGLFSEEAIAQEASGSCIVAGAAGEYKGNSCKAPQALINKDQSCIKCNPEIYGSDSPCLKLSGDKLPSDATERCNNQTETKKYQVFEGVKNSSDVNNRKNELAGVLTDLRQQCSEIIDGVGKGSKLSDQTATCENLNARVNELEAANCQLLKQQPNQFGGLSCHDHRDKNDRDDKEDRTDKDGKSEREVVGSSCGGLPKDYSELSCQSRQIRKLKCDDGKTQAYYCECGVDEDPIFSNTEKPKGCSIKQKTTSRYEGRKSSRSKSSSSFFTPGMQTALIMLLAGGAYLAFNMYQQKQQYKSMMQYYTQPAVATPVPAPYTATPIPTVVPTTTGTTGTTGTR